MKKENVLLAASLLLNAGLLAFLAIPAATAPSRASPQLPAAASVPQDTPRVSASSAAADVRAPAKGAGADAPTAGTANAKRTRSSQGIRALVAELRRRGVDEGTVRRLGVAHAERLFRLEARALFSTREKLDYWRAPTAFDPFGQVEPAKVREFQRLRRERVEVLDELFGDVEAEATEHNTVNHYLVDSGEFLFEYAPLAKRLALTEFFEREATGIGQTPVQRLRSQITPSARRELENAEKIQGILGPDLYDEYLLQSSGVASRLKYELAAMQPTRAEFDQLVHAEYALVREQSAALAALRRGPDGVIDPASVRKLADARRAVVRDVLGDARYADYERATDDAYRHLDQIARELGLGTSAARSAFAHVERAREQVLALSPEGANLADPKVMDAMRKIRDETRDRVADEFGLQGLTDSEQHMVLGQALNIHPQQVARRMYRWF